MLPYLIHKLKSDLLAILEWMDKNGMTLNLDKTQFILIGSTSNLNKVGVVEFEVNGIVIKSQNELKSLGLIIDSKLSWSKHINSISRRFHMVATSLYPLKKVMSQSSLILIFQACLISLFNYMVIIWGSSCAVNLKCLEMSIRRTARFILNVKKYDSVSKKMKEKLRWLLPKDNYYFKAFCFFFQTRQNPIPFFESFLEKNSDFHNYPTRSSNLLRVNFCPKNSMSSKSLHFTTTIAWNRLPTELKETQNFKLFKTNLKTLFLNYDYEFISTLLS